MRLPSRQPPTAQPGEDQRHSIAQNGLHYDFNQTPYTFLTTAIMVFIFGVNFPEHQLVSRSLKSFYGIGPDVCTKLMSKFHIHQTAKIGALGDRQINDLAAELSTMTLENDLRRQLQENIKRLRDMGTYRGRRHAMSLPVRGQNTRSQVSQNDGDDDARQRQVMLRQLPDHDGAKAEPGGEKRLAESRFSRSSLLFSSLLCTFLASIIGRRRKPR
ncbi:hypothetical protein D0867_01659 [Hortaea werneckii]|uniref:30S ribosomal protein S13 n=1 Tax=Hortaea werneckii TaxID=91943 RepID=A0A3M7A9C8_HORWE|nr:hypothetical protein D0867_01659 [Hortaea werneckii]